MIDLETLENHFLAALQPHKGKHHKHIFVIQAVVTIIQQFAAQDAGKKRRGAQVQKTKKQKRNTDAP